MEFNLNGYMPLNVSATIEADTEEEAREKFAEEIAMGFGDYIAGGEFVVAPESELLEINDVSDTSAYNDENTVTE